MTRCYTYETYRCSACGLVRGVPYTVRDGLRTCELCWFPPAMAPRIPGIVYTLIVCVWLALMVRVCGS